MIFQKFGTGKGLPGSHPHAKFYRFGLVNVGLQPKKIAKNSNFWYKSTPKKKSSRSIEKVEYRCTTRNLPLCTGTIIVFKKFHCFISFPLSHTSSFQSATKNRQTYRQKNHTFSSTAGARPRIPTILGMVIEEVRPILHSPNFF